MLGKTGSKNDDLFAEKRFAFMAGDSVMSEDIDRTQTPSCSAIHASTFSNSASDMTENESFK